MNIASNIILETADYVIVDKPAGLLSIPDREGKEISLKVLLKEKYGSIFTVHRLDKETSGLILFAKNEATHKFLSETFTADSSSATRSIKKIYRGIVIGSLENEKGTVDLPIAEHPARNGTMVINQKGKAALTSYEVIEDFGIYSLVEFRIFTGRTHQIRVHMKEIGHPILCDRLYGDGKPLLVSSIKSKFKLGKYVEEERPLVNRLALHSFQLSFNDAAGKLIAVEAPLPKDLRAALQQLGKRKSKKQAPGKDQRSG